MHEHPNFCTEGLSDPQISVANEFYVEFGKSILRESGDPQPEHGKVIASWLSDESISPQQLETMLQGIQQFCELGPLAKSKELFGSLMIEAAVQKKTLDVG